MWLCTHSATCAHESTINYRSSRRRDVAQLDIRHLYYFPTTNSALHDVCGHEDFHSIFTLELIRIWIASFTWFSYIVRIIHQTVYLTTMYIYMPTRIYSHLYVHYA